MSVMLHVPPKEHRLDAVPGRRDRFRAALVPVDEAKDPRTTSPDPTARSIARIVEAPVVTTSSRIATRIPGEDSSSLDPLLRPCFLGSLRMMNAGTASRAGRWSGDGGHDRIRPEGDPPHRLRALPCSSIAQMSRP